MNGSSKKWGKVDLNPDAKTATIFLEETVPDEGLIPKQAVIGRCAWKDRYAAERTVERILIARKYHLDRLLTADEVAEIKQDMRQAGY